MSLNALWWVASGAAPVADTNEYAVLTAMAEPAGNDGCGSWLSKETIAARARLSVEAVRRCRRTLLQRGLIARGDQSLVAGYRADRRPVVYDLLIPFTWFPDPGKVNAERAQAGRPPLTPEDRPPIAAAPVKPPRADKGKPRPGRRKTAAGRGVSQTPRAGGLTDTPPPARAGDWQTDAGPAGGGLTRPVHGGSGNSPAEGSEGGVTGDTTRGTRPLAAGGHGGARSAADAGAGPAQGGLRGPVHGGSDNSPAGAPSPGPDRDPGGSHGGTTSSERGHYKLSTGALAVPQTSYLNRSKKPGQEAPAARSASDARRASTGSSGRTRVSGCAASDGAAAPQQVSRPGEDATARERGRAVRAVWTALPAALRALLPKNPPKPFVRVVTEALDYRTVPELAARAERRWWAHGYASAFGRQAVGTAVGVAVALVRVPECPVPECEDGVLTHTGAECRACAERHLDYRTARRAGIVPVPRNGQGPPALERWTCTQCERPGRGEPPADGRCADCTAQAAAEAEHAQAQDAAWEASVAAAVAAAEAEGLTSPASF